MTYPAQVTQLKELPDVLAVSDRRIKQPPRISELAPCRQNGPNSAVYSNEFAGLLVELGTPSVDAGISAIRRYRQTEDSHHSATLFGGAMACLLAAGISVAMWLSISANNTESLQTAGQTAFVDAEREVPDAPQSPKALPASIHRASSVLQAAVDAAPIRPRMPVIQTAAYSTDAPTSQSEAETFPKSSTPDETATSSNSNDFPPHPAGRAEQMERPPDSRKQTEPEEGYPNSRPSAGYESERDPKGRSPQTQLATIRTASNTVASEISPPSEQSAEDPTATKDNSNSDLGPSDSADSRGTSDGSSADAEAASGPKGGKSSKSGKNTQSAGSDSSESKANGNSQSQESSTGKEKKGKPSKGSSSQSGSRDTADARNSQDGGNKGQSSKDADGKGKGTKGSDGKGHKGEGK